MQKRFQKIYFQNEEWSSSWRIYGKCEKIYRYQACNNRSKKELFGVKSKLSYNKKIPDNLLAIEMKRTRILMNKPIYLGLSILEISKITMYEFWYDYVKPKCGEKVKLSNMDTDSLKL